MKRIVAAAAVLPLLSACISTEPEGPSPYEGQWQIGQLGGESVMPQPRQTAPTLTIIDGRISADLGCNSFNGNWPKQGEAFGPQASTRMGCPQSLMQWEQAYGDALAQANNYRIEYSRLQLLAGDSVVLEAWRPADVLQWQGWDGQWNLTQLTGADAIQGLADGRAPYLTLNLAQDRASGNSGCNQFFATPRVAGEALQLSHAGMTLVACPDNLMNQEQLMMKHFSEANRTVEVENKLQWWRGDELLLEFVKAQ
ncbi:META domain-containing protein [Ferrimonas marina]|uniref:Heat shock protein HslJ n=1 Tax=Ferrimonas marina TaxID=299255 RepID=A0A1M5RMN6_9GAMM|nr:META domain-containing protein [Ferrimonas marina]SHH27505.1 Heat shock protein HslJ [Ferrimonas marina]